MVPIEWLLLSDHQILIIVEQLPHGGSNFCGRDLSDYFNRKTDFKPIAQDLIQPLANVLESRPIADHFIQAIML